MHRRSFRRIGFFLGLVVVLGVFAISANARAADQIVLGTQLNTPEFQFNGTGTSTIDILLEDCSGGVCTMSTGNGFGTGIFSGATIGTYTFSSSVNNPFTLTCLGNGNFAVNQTGTIDFSFTSAGGTLTGTVEFLTESDAGNGSMTGLLTVTGGTFAADFPTSFGDISVTLANGFPLQTLCGANGSVNSEIDGAIITPQVPTKAVCPLTQGFWKNHPSSWPVGSLNIGGTTVSEANLITNLKTPPQHGNATLILTHQLIAALLDIANGTPAPSNVVSAITDAQTLLSGLIASDGTATFVSASSSLGTQMVNDANTLDSFNNGAFTSGCSGD